MITEKDRISTCINKYGLSEEEATRIVKESDDLLNIEELRMKYDYPELGIKYPEWLTPIEHYKMCCATVKSMYNSNYASICTPEEMASILYVKSSVKLKQIHTFQHLKVGLVTIAMNLYRDNSRRQKYWSDKTLDTEVETKDGSVMTGYDVVVAKDKEDDEIKCLLAVKSIKNREVREILILCGFIIGGLESFRNDFMDIVSNSDLIKRDAMVELMEKVKHNEDADIEKQNNKSAKIKKHRINFKAILKCINTDMDEVDARKEIGDYLAFTGFMPN